jgi:hypothetical protein
MNTLRNFFTLLLFSFLIFLSTSPKSFAQSGADLPLMPGGIFKVGTVPVNGTNEVQTITLTNFSSGTLRLSFLGKNVVVTFAGAEANAAIDTLVDAALEGLATIGTGGVSVVTSGTTSRAIAVTFAGNLARLNVDPIVATVLTGTNTVGVATTTPGVTADGRASVIGQLAVTQDAGLLYINTSTTLLSPTWVKVGAQ